MAVGRGLIALKSRLLSENLGMCGALVSCIESGCCRVCMHAHTYLQPTHMHVHVCAHRHMRVHKDMHAHATVKLFTHCCFYSLLNTNILFNPIVHLRLMPGVT